MFVYMLVSPFVRLKVSSTNPQAPPPLFRLKLCRIEIFNQYSV